MREVFQAPHVTTGELTGSRGYSCQKAIALARDPRLADTAKLEAEVSNLLDDLYVETKQWKDRDPNDVMLPLGLDLMPDEIQNEPKYKEIKALVLAGAKEADADEVAWLKKRFSYSQKTQSWIDTFPAQLIGVPYNKTNQIQKFSNPNPTAEPDYEFATDLIGLDIKDFWIGMLGAVEVLASTEAGTSFYKDQTVLRAKDRRQRRSEAPGAGRDCAEPPLQLITPRRTVGLPTVRQPDGCGACCTPFS